MQAQTALRIALTAVVVGLALILAHLLWRHYLYSPWTRDGRVRATVIRVAPDVSGLVTAVDVQDNAFVHEGQVLFTIDPKRFADAVARAEADLAAARASLQAAHAAVAEALAGRKAGQVQYALRKEQAARRDTAAAGVVSQEERSDANAAARLGQADLAQAQARVQQAEAAQAQAAAAVQQAQAALRLARLNLERTVVRAPTDGYVANLQLDVGDYAPAGAPRLALIDSHSFYIEGEFEETKLPRLHVGDPVDIRLMAGDTELHGRITGIARGIAAPDAGTAPDGLSNINPVFDWVRLAQRVPVHIAIDTAHLPPGLHLAAGMTATLVVHPQGGR